MSHMIIRGWETPNRNQTPPELDRKKSSQQQQILSKIPVIPVIFLVLIVPFVSFSMLFSFFVWRRGGIEGIEGIEEKGKRRGGGVRGGGSGRGDRGGDRKKRGRRDDEDIRDEVGACVCVFIKLHMCLSVWERECPCRVEPSDCSDYYNYLAPIPPHPSLIFGYNIYIIYII